MKQSTLRYAMLRKDQIINSSAKMASASSQEVAKFEAMTQEWRDPKGKYKAVHAFNDVRIPYLLSEIQTRMGEPSGARPHLKGLRIADIGCATGLISEAIAKHGGEVLAIDAAANNIEIAKHCAQEQGLEINYQMTVPEFLESETSSYDAVLTLEVVEHVGDLPVFLNATGKLVKPGGLLIVGTLNRTIISYFKAILGAEYILRLLPRGTHDWRAFVRPHELDGLLQPDGFARKSLVGVELQPIGWKWQITDNPSVNYMAIYQKNYR